MARPVRGRGRPTASKHPGKGSGAQAHGSTVTPEAQARLPELLVTPPRSSGQAESDAVSRFTAIAAETPGGPLALIEALGSSRDEAAGRVLAAVATATPDRGQRKAARRALHRLRSTGIAVALPVAAEPGPVAPAPTETLRPIQALVSPTDGVGSRLLWLLLERPHGGLTMFNLAINDVVGLKDDLIEETTRRRFDQRIEGWNERTEHRAIEVPVEYGLALLSEALALNAESHFPLPRDFVIRRSLLGELPPPPTDALIHQHVSRGQTFLMPNLLEESAGLLEGEPELMGWIFGYDEVKQFAREYRQATESRLLLTSEPPEARQERIIGTAIDTLFTPTMRRAFRRRLEETAYIFWQTDRQRSARQAVAAAFAIGDTGSIRSHPLLREIVVRSIEMAIEVDRSGMPLPPGANRTARTPI
jgi:hypothetical protein